ncbi:MAG: B12-binding domain-containing radical SAM protein [Planctomycetota bacterium]
MKISLIEPCSPDYHVYSMLAIPRLGLPLLGTVLSRQGHEVKVYVEDLQAIGSAEALEILQSDLVGISATSSTAPRGYAMARLLRLRGIPVVFGGVHPTFMPEEPLRYADYVITGQAEQTLPALVDALEDGGDLDAVPNLLYNRDEDVARTAEEPQSMELDEMPIPDYSLIEGRDQMNIMPVVTTRGCPHNCTFCCVSPMFGHCYRMKSVDRVVEELRRIGKQHVFFCDDNFTASRTRAKELLGEMLRQEVYPSRWYAQVRADTYKDDELLELMRRTNCQRVFVGFESVSQRVLDSYHKHQSMADLQRCAEVFHDHDIAVHGMFMFGADEDDKTVFGETVNFAIEHGIDTVQFLILTPVPGSELFNQLEEQGRIFTRDWTLYDGHHVVFEPARMSPLELQLETLRANRRFYSMRSVLRSLSCLRMSTAMLRYLGRRVLRGWRKANRRFIQTLRNWQDGRQSFPERFSVQRLQADLPMFRGSG